MALRPVVAAFLVMSGAGWAAPAAAQTATFSASATVTSPVSIQADSGLQFGAIGSGASPGSVMVGPLGDRSVSGGASAAAGTAVAASFTVTGAPSTAYVITLPSASVIANGTSSMVVSFAVTDLSDGTLSRIVGADGTDSFHLGGRLDVGGNQEPGAYTGDFIITLSY